MSKRMFWMVLLMVLLPTAAAAEVSFGTDVGVDVGMVGTPGTPIEERAGGISYLHLLGLSATTEKSQFVLQTGIPIPPSFSLQAVFDASYYPRGVRRSGVVLGSRLRALPIWWMYQEGACAGLHGPCRPIEGSWGVLGEPSIGWQIPIPRLFIAVRPTLAYSAGVAASHQTGLARFYHGGVFTLHVQSFDRDSMRR